MPRVPQVTRSIKTTTAEVLCLNVETEETFKRSITLTRTYKDDASMLKKIKAMCDTDTEKVIHIISSEVDVKRYGMTEVEFIKVATVIED